jgi:hypothetical protein
LLVLGIRGAVKTETRDDDGCFLKIILGEVVRVSLAFVELEIRERLFEDNLFLLQCRNVDFC